MAAMQSHIVTTSSLHHIFRFHSYLVLSVRICFFVCLHLFDGPMEDIGPEVARSMYIFVKNRMAFSGKTVYVYILVILVLTYWQIYFWNLAF